MTWLGAAIIVFALCTLAFMWLAFTAPHGWQDRDGYHDGESPQ